MQYRLRTRFILCLILPIAYAISFTQAYGSELGDGPRSSDRRVALFVALRMRLHLSEHDLDDEISKRALGQFLKMLDPLKIYFNDSDIKEFKKSETSIDNMLKDQDISLAYKIYKRYQERVSERVKLINSLLGGEFSFDKDELYVSKPEELNHPKNEAEAKERWRKRLKYDLLVLKSDGTKEDEAKDRLRRRYKSFASRVSQTNPDELLEMYISSITSSYDPHSTYFSPSTLNDFRIRMSLEYEGIGAELESKDGYAMIRRIIPGGAAEKNGKLKPKDRIVSVGEGTEGDMFDVVDKKLSDIVAKIRGKRNTIVRLGVIPEGETEVQIYNITRDRIELKDSEAKGLIIEHGKKADGTKAKVGVIVLPSFYMDMQAAQERKKDYKSTTRDVKKILDDFNAKGVDVLVMDLRQNGGGSLSEAIDCTGLFIKKGPVVSVKNVQGNIETYEDENEAIAWTKPMVVLTDKFSASASEILAGAIQDYKRGIVIGDTSTHGKGTVQSLLDLSQGFRLLKEQNLGALKLTLQQFYRPNGDSTQKRGVLSDIVLPSISNHMDVTEADLDFPVEFDKLENQAEFDSYGLVSDDIVAKLKKKTKERQSASSDFTRLKQRIDLYKKRKEREGVPLLASKYEKDAEEAKKLDDSKDDDKDDDTPKKPIVFERTPYANEVIALTVDYLNLLGENNSVKKD